MTRKAKGEKKFKPGELLPRPKKGGNRLTSPTMEQRIRGGITAGARSKEAWKALKALESGELVPARKDDDPRASCPKLLSIRRAAARLAGTTPPSYSLTTVPPPPVPAELLQLQKIDPVRRAKLLSD